MCASSLAQGMYFIMKNNNMYIHMYMKNRCIYIYVCRVRSIYIYSQ